MWSAVTAAWLEQARHDAFVQHCFAHGRLAAAGARVMIVSRSVMELVAVGLEYVAADLGTAEGCALAVEETERRLGPIDVLVVNHGIGSAHERLVWEQDPEVWRETMRINLDGPFELARLTVGGMCKRGFGRLVFTSSTAGEKAERSGSAYTASKHGLIGLARAIAQDAGPFAVTSNAVLPGWVRTEMAERSARSSGAKCAPATACCCRLAGSISIWVPTCFRPSRPSSRTSPPLWLRPSSRKSRRF